MLLDKYELFALHHCAGLMIAPLHPLRGRNTRRSSGPSGLRKCSEHRQLVDLLDKPVGVVNLALWFRCLCVFSFAIIQDLATLS